jgi:hypothetical protein
MKQNGCPGAANIKGTPSLKVKTCPNCQNEVEIFSNEIVVECHCGFKIYNDLISCVRWCKLAKECIGEELYAQLVETAEHPLDHNLNK